MNVKKRQTMLIRGGCLSAMKRLSQVFMKLPGPVVRKGMPVM